MMAKKKAKAKRKAKTRTLCMVRGTDGISYLSADEMSLRQASHEDGFEAVFLSSSCREILRLPLPKREGARLRITYTVKPAPKPKAKKKGK